MYINGGQGYYSRTGNQHARRGDFLMLIQPKDDPDEMSQTDKRSWNYPIKAIVRKVALTQMGHWMMGYARVYGQRLTVSGAYGHDGLIMAVPPEIYNRAAVELPADLVEKWNKGGGWNSCGNEAPDMRQWALENIDALKK